MIDVKNYIPLIDKLQTKYIIISVILLFFLIVVVINVFSYINILSKSSENPAVPKSRATARLIADVVLMIILIFFVGYYGYKYFNPNPFVTKGKEPYFNLKGKFPEMISIGSNTGCTDADSMSLAEKIKPYIKNDIDLRPNDCNDKGCKSRLKDPRNEDVTKCKNYDAKQLAKSFPKF